MRFTFWAEILLMILIFLSGCSSGIKTQDFYGDGSVQREGRSVFIKGDDGEDVLAQHGRWKGWHRNGRLASDVTYKMGEIIGVSRRWYDNGQLASKDHHDETGLAHGVSKVWDREGTLLNETTFVRGTGTQRYYYPAGQLKSTIPTVKNLAEGVEIHYNMDGSIKKKIIYSKGKAVKEFE